MSMETSSTHNKIHVPRFIPQRLALLRKKRN